MKSSAKKISRGFTLIELVIAMLLIALLFGMVFATSRASLELGNNIVKTQNEEMLQQAFFDMLEKRFSSLPGNTRLDIQVTDSPSHYLSDLTLENVPLAFTWGNQERTANAVQLSTVLRRSGLLDIVLRYYENPILDTTSSTSSNRGFGSTATDEPPFAEITLLSNVRYFEWRILNPTTVDYQYEWEETGKLPTQLELTLAFGADGPPIKHIFWIPPKQNPEVFMRQLQVRGNNPGNNQNPNIQVPTPGSPPVVIPTPTPSQ